MAPAAGQERTAAVLTIDFVALDGCVGLKVDRVKVKAVASGDEAEGLFEVGAEFVRGACFARVVSGNGESGAKLAV